MTAALHFLLAVLALPHDPAAADGERFTTSRVSRVELPLPGEEDAFVFAVFGDRTGGPAEGVEVLADAVRDVNLFEPDLVMTVGDLVEGYNEADEWLVQMREFREIMDGLLCPWFPVAGNHDVYWRGEGDPPPGEHEGRYEDHFGPLWYAFRHKSAWFVALYTDEGNPETGKKAFGAPASQRISDEQLAWLDATLGRASEAEHVFVFLHHPRWRGGGYGDDWERVHRRLAAAGNVTAVFAGHIHQMTYEGPRDGVEYFTLATVGGHQKGIAPEAGWLHHYDLVTVRRDRIAVAAVPVGATIDPRAVTGELSRGVELAEAALSPELLERPRHGGDGAVRGAWRLAFENPGPGPVEVLLRAGDGTLPWIVRPDHVHLELAPGAREEVRLAGGLPPGGWELVRAEPRLEVEAAYLGERLRVPYPDRELRLGLDPPPDGTFRGEGGERELVLDGEDHFAEVPSAALDLPDGPVTVECWLNAERLEGEQGLVSKTQSSELGLFLTDGHPRFFVHLGGRYTVLRAPERLGTGRWHHVAGTYDGGEVRLHVDGRPVAREAARGARRRNDLPLLVGAEVSRGGAGTDLFRGRLDEVRVSAAALYDDAFDPPRELPPAPATRLHLSFQRRSGPFVEDASGRGAHARLRGGAGTAPAAW